MTGPYATIQPDRGSEPGKHPPIGAIALVAVLLLILGAWVAIDRGAARWYVYQPGTAPEITVDSHCKVNSSGSLVLPNGRPCALLSLPAGKASGIQGSIFMVDVLVGPANPWQYLLWKAHLKSLLGEGTQFIPKVNAIGNTPSNQVACQDTQQMVDATTVAPVVALRSLGLQVKENDLGAQLDLIIPGSAAAAAGLECNDLITAVNDTRVHTSDQLSNALHAYKPGQTVHITFQRDGQNGKPATRTVPVRLGSFPASAGQPAETNRAFLGVQLETRTTFTLPFDVTINVGNIGGPSDGLALTLGILDALTGGQLTGGHRIAATGTISTDGTVGEIGGAAQKAVAVRRAGAQVFFVPSANFHDAQSQAGSMKVYAVSNLKQALADLKALGGHVPASLTSHN